nr:reverse transcriptase domain-containing protein [Tanacetum cinerariifolium]
MVDDNVGNQLRQNAVQNHGNAKVVAVRVEGNSNGINGILIRCYNCQGEGAYDEIEEVNANCTIKDNLQHASTSGTQTESSLVYDSDRSAEDKICAYDCYVMHDCLDRMGTPTQYLCDYWIGWIMPPRMRTRSVGRPTAETLGGGTGVRVARGGRARRPREGNDKHVDDLNSQGNDQGMGANRVGNQGNIGNQNGNVVNENVQENVGNVIVNGNQAGHVAYTDRFHELARLVPHLVTLRSRKIERNGSIKKVKKRGNVREPSKDKSGRDDNKRTRTGNVFATTINPVGRENMGTWCKCTNYNSYHALGGPCRICFNCNCSGHLEKDYRGVPRNVNPFNARNPLVRACYEYGSINHVRVFMLGAEEARRDSNIMTGIEPSELGFRYEIEIASGQLVEIDKEIEFQIELIPKATPVAKSPYRLAPSELEELSGQLKEL